MHKFVCLKLGKNGFHDAELIHLVEAENEKEATEKIAWFSSLKPISKNQLEDKDGAIYRVMHESTVPERLRELSMNRVEAEELFYNFKELGVRAGHLAAIVQNPDFVKTNNAKEDFDEFKKQYTKLVNDLQTAFYQVSELFQRVDPFNEYPTRTISEDTKTMEFFGGDSPLTTFHATSSDGIEKLVKNVKEDKR